MKTKNMSVPARSAVTVAGLGAAVLSAATAASAAAPHAAAATPAASANPLAYIANDGFGSNTVTVIRTGTNTAGKPITVGNEPEGIAITPNGTTASVTNNARQGKAIRMRFHRWYMRHFRPETLWAARMLMEYGDDYDAFRWAY